MKVADFRRVKANHSCGFASHARAASSAARRVQGVWLVALLLAGCGETGAGSDGASGSGKGGDAAQGGASVGGRDGGGAAARGGGASQGAAGGTSEEGGTDACNDAPSSPDAVCVESVRGRLLDADDRPAPEGLLLTACGARQCEPGFTAADGSFTIRVGFALVPADYSVLAHGRPHHGAFYFGLPADATGPDVDMGTLRYLPMPAAGPLIVSRRDGAPAQSLTSGDVTLHTPDGSFVRLDVESTSFGDEGRVFRAVRVPDGLLSDFAAPSLGLLALYGFEPFEAQVEAAGSGEPLAFRLSFADALGLPPSAPVEVLALGSFVYPDWLSPAAFEPVAMARVSPDGATIEMEPGEGVRYLTWVGLRAAR